MNVHSNVHFDDANVRFSQTNVRFDKTLSFSECNGDAKKAEEKLRQLTRLSQSQYMSLGQVCEFYEVEREKILRVLKEYSGEFKEDDVITVTEDCGSDIYDKYGAQAFVDSELTGEMWEVETEYGDYFHTGKFSLVLIRVSAVRRMGVLLSGVPTVG